MNLLIHDSLDSGRNYSWLVGPHLFLSRSVEPLWVDWAGLSLVVTYRSQSVLMAYSAPLLCFFLSSPPPPSRRHENSRPSSGGLVGLTKPGRYIKQWAWVSCVYLPQSSRQAQFPDRLLYFSYCRFYSTLVHTVNYFVWVLIHKAILGNQVLPFQKK